MLDPREQQKGGFGAFADRQREQQSVEHEPIAGPGGATSTPGPVSQAAGDVPADAAAPMRRRRFFGFLLP